MRGLAPVLGFILCLAVWLVPEPAPFWPFADHMVRHMAVVAVAAPLIALGLAPTLPVLPPPLAAVAIELFAVWGWHLPAAHEAAQTERAFLVAEQLSFLVAGLLVWLAVLQPGRALAGAGGLLLTSMHMTLLGALLLLAAHPLYPAAICGSLADQQLGGMLMIGLGAPIYFMGGVALVGRVLADGPEGARAR